LQDPEYFSLVDKASTKQQHSIWDKLYGPVMFSIGQEITQIAISMFHHVLSMFKLMPVTTPSYKNLFVF
jgi:hypothetical protein